MSTKTNVVRDEQFPILLPNGRGVQKYTLKAAKELLVNLKASIDIVEKRRANSGQGEPKPLPTTQVKSSADATAYCTLPANIKDQFTRFIAEQKDIPSEFAEVVNDNFWDLVAR